MNKRVQIGARPSKPLPPAADSWVESRTEGEPASPTPKPEEKMKRLTIDIPISLHRKVKTECASSGETIRDVVVDLLIKKYGNP